MYLNDIKQCHDSIVLDRHGYHVLSSKLWEYSYSEYIRLNDIREELLDSNVLLFGSTYNFFLCVHFSYIERELCCKFVKFSRHKLDIYDG